MANTKPKIENIRLVLLPDVLSELKGALGFCVYNT